MNNFKPIDFEVDDNDNSAYPTRNGNKNKETQYTVKLQYFKKSGKFYSEGGYKTKEQFPFKIQDEIREMKEKGKLPGINGDEWIVYADLSNCPNGYPLLIL